MTDLPVRLDPPPAARLGLILLQADATLEAELPRLTPHGATTHVTRVPSGLEVTSETLPEMIAHLPAAAGLLPRGHHFRAVAYACTSGTAVIGRAKVAELVRQGVPTDAVTDPVSALIAACGALGVSRIGLLSPYVAEVSDQLRAILATDGIETPVFGSFNIAEEERVTRISGRSVIDGATALARRGGIDALFLSCTNLRTLDLIEEIEA
jgi:maleate isomerase